MAPIRRRAPEPPPGPPRIEFKPGMANEMLRELAPLLAEEGIDVDNIPDMQTLRRAMNRAVERTGTPHLPQPDGAGIASPNTGL
ncbi:hypothetical protein QTQ03_25935 [Micromonospora sp. WMMA1363]|uniref:hypothetical protein n=1 Tax=Micromonospora sp. WMMA1363 TaxID=3053985 RepID=UPI00259D09EA|nr:hypothetical protein [Micromonospora sp. WMMA1363]MDM4722873.1 hypothetical protein [Micromonospora sp. WMMA1363]